MLLLACADASLFAAFPWYERHIQLAGLVISTAGLVSSAFVTKVSRTMCFGQSVGQTAKTPLAHPVNAISRTTTKPLLTLDGRR